MANGQAMFASVSVMCDTIEWMHMTQVEMEGDDGMRDACANGIVVIRMQKAYENLISLLLSRPEGGGRRSVVIVK